MYHFYFDQGGMFGRPFYKVTSKKLRQREDDNWIGNYYVGHMSGWAITQMVQLFNHRYGTSLELPTLNGMTI